MEAKPLRVVPSSDDRAGEGGGPQKKIDRGRSRTMEGFEEKRGLVVKEEYSAIKLGLGVGAYSAAINPVVAREKPLFTEAQRRELEHQTFIFKHFALNVPVPQYLVLPILESLAGTSESGLGVRWFSPQGFGYGNMDPEPHRCRRTDGKKWRCREKVLPDQKYCERHMHRGCNRSRKPVETSEVNSSFLTKPSGKLHSKLSSNTKSAVPVLVPNPLGTKLIDTSIFTTSSSPCTIETFCTDRCKSSISSAGTRTSISPASVVYASSTFATVAVPQVTTISSMTSIAANNKSYLNFCKKDDISKSCISHSNIGVQSSGIGSIINDSNISTRIGFSPRSVLQAITVSSGHHSGIIDRNNTELEPGRCRRTDGKKWRCRSAVLPDQKYCATHMHRGAKKRFADHEPSANPLTSAVTIARLPPTAAKPNIHKAYYTVPNINLSMSIPACAPLTQCKEENPSSSSDTDTTISDTMNDYSHASFPETVSKLAPV